MLVYHRQQSLEGCCIVGWCIHQVHSIASVSSAFLHQKRGVSSTAPVGSDVIRSPSAEGWSINGYTQRLVYDCKIFTRSLLYHRRHPNAGVSSAYLYPKAGVSSACVSSAPPESWCVIGWCIIGFSQTVVYRQLLYTWSAMYHRLHLKAGVSSDNIHPKVGVSSASSEDWCIIDWCIVGICIMDWCIVGFT